MPSGIFFLPFPHYYFNHFTPFASDVSLLLEVRLCKCRRCSPFTLTNKLKKKLGYKGLTALIATNNRHCESRHDSWQSRRHCEA